MAFVMRGEVKIEGKQGFSASSMKWSNTVLSYINEAEVVLPSKCYYQGRITSTSSALKEGLKITINAGYNHQQEERFVGFISRVEHGVPLKLICEGYSYQLKAITDYTKNFINTEVKTILQDLVQGTDIVLSERIPSIPIEKVSFVNITGVEVLDWLKEQCLLTVYFVKNELYVGLEQVETVEEVNVRLGWNTARESGLSFGERQLAEVNIQLESREKTGVKTKTKTGVNNIKTLKTLLNDEASKKKIAEQKRKELVNLGYEGTIDMFLEPLVEAGQTAAIKDTAFPDRNGNYFVSGVEGSFSRSGGRQKISVAYQI